MILFAIFTIGYFAGVITALAVFPPQVKEIEEQEIGALRPILEVEKEKELERERVISGQPTFTSS